MQRGGGDDADLTGALLRCGRRECRPAVGGARLVREKQLRLRQELPLCHHRDGVRHGVGRVPFPEGVRVHDACALVRDGRAVHMSDVAHVRLRLLLYLRDVGGDVNQRFRRRAVGRGAREHELLRFEYPACHARPDLARDLERCNVSSGVHVHERAVVHRRNQLVLVPPALLLHRRHGRDELVGPRAEHRGHDL